MHIPVVTQHSSVELPGLLEGLFSLGGWHSNTYPSVLSRHIPVTSQHSSCVWPGIVDECSFRRPFSPQSTSGVSCLFAFPLHIPRQAN
eukprot:COSAG04_NODE_6636_length_1287_cov_1.628788_2_plen_87_part_01